MFTVSMAFAQQKVTGVVIEAETGEPVIGASVKVKGTTLGAATNYDGKFTLEVPSSSSTLVVSYIGMKTKEVAAKANLKVFLESDSKTLNEQVVVAYGTQSKASFTGAAATIKADKIEKAQVSSVERALEGAVAGVQLTSTSNTPGSSAKLIVRGIGSISSEQSPLIVVDGVAYEGSLNSISSQDIETMTILKDAAANSMYGARGANGVIMITTKRGGTGKPRINFDAKWGTNTRGVQPYETVDDPGQWYELMWESVRNYARPSFDTVEEANAFATNKLISGYAKYNVYKNVADNEVVGTDGKLNPNCNTLKWNDNWAKDPFESQLRQEYNVNISAGNENTQVYASASYLNDKGYVVGSGFERFAGRLKLDQTINNYIKVGANFSYSRTDQSKFNSNEESNYSNIFMFSQMIAPIYPIYYYDADGNRALNNDGGMYDFGTEYKRPYSAEQNPYAVAQASLYDELWDNFSSRGYIQINLPFGFKFTSNIAYDLFNQAETNFMTPIGGDAAAFNGRSYQYSRRNQAINANQLLDWNYVFDENHKVHVLLGHESKKDTRMYKYGHMTNFVDPSIPDFSNAAKYQDITSYTSALALESYFAKAEYNFIDRYYLNASIRRDGSSRFAKENRWGSFWAVGAAWRIKEESWMKDVDFFDDLKIKASFGTQGNDNVGYYHNYVNLYSVERVDGEPVLDMVNRGNANLTWEKSRNFNAGFETKFLNRFTVDFDFFIKKTNDLLYRSPVPLSEGKPFSVYRNEMDMKNTGIEVTVGADIIKNSDLTWNVSLNATHYKNELTKLPASKPAELFPDGYQAGSYWRKIGGTLYDWYCYEYVGVDPETGKVQYNAYKEMTPEKWNSLSEEQKAAYVSYDGKEAKYIVNSDSKASLRQTGKSALPAVTGGLSTSIEYKGIDFSVQTAFSIGGWVRDSFYGTLMNPGKPGQSFHKDMLNRWTETNTNTDVPALCYNNQSEYTISTSSDYFLTSASYFSLRNITLGYTFPKSWLYGTPVEKVRVYFAGDNIWLKSARKGLDPRQDFDGTTGYNYSALSSYSVGINLSF